MKAYFVVRHKLAEFYSKPSEWEYAAREIDLDENSNHFAGYVAERVGQHSGHSARTPERIQLLRALIDRDFPELSLVGAAYAARWRAARRLSGIFADLEDVDLSDGDLAPEAVGGLLKFSETLPQKLLSISLREGVPSADEVDEALAGKNTASAKARLAAIRQEYANERALLNNRQSTAR